MNHASQSQQPQDSASAGKTPGICAGMRAIPCYDQETGRLTRVTLTRRPPRDGASISVPEERPDLDAGWPPLHGCHCPDLDAALPPLRGWHWFRDRGDILCELMPLIRDVLAQIADDIARDRLDDYRLGGVGAFADGLEEVATRRMSLPPDEAEFQCARLLRQYQDHLRRIGADDED